MALRTPTLFPRGLSSRLLAALNTPLAGRLGSAGSGYSPIAIDFGADSLKLLQLRLGDRPELAVAASKAVPGDARADMVQRRAFLGEALKELVRGHPFHGRQVICAIPAFQTLVHLLTFSRVEPEEMELQVQLQLQERLNVDPSKMVVRHVPVAEVNREGQVQQEVLCMAASRDVVMDYIEMIHACRLEIVGLHCEPLTLLRAMQAQDPEAAEAQQTVGYVDIGAATSKFVIAHGSEIAFAKTIQAAGDQLTQHLAQSEKIGFDEARARRMQAAEDRAHGPEAAREDTRAEAAGAAPVGEPVEGSSGGTGLAALDAQMGLGGTGAPGGGAAETKAEGSGGGDDTVDCLIDELQLSLRYHKRMFPQRAVGKLVFTGGEAADVQLCQRIARSLRIAAELGDPLSEVGWHEQATVSGVDLSQPQPGWSLAYGLCLSQVNV